MTDNNDLSLEGIERLPLKVFTENAYLEYSMYVILDRALPHIGDGLKPVQRRIIYAMHELGLRSTAKYKKSARTVGDVLGKFHPHGDSACYEAMVLMAQPFSYRYPFVDGQGNWGAPDDPKSFAAMRYTEAKLSEYAMVLLEELSLGAVSFVPNFDGTLTEPEVLPALLPNILLNGTTGIAVGMATDIPPHNLREVANACIHMIDHPTATTQALCAFVKAPDYPTEAEIITPGADILSMYESGNGTIKMRAVFHHENGDIVITAIPHQVSGAKIIEQIAAQMQEKKLPMVADLRDESDHEAPTRIVVVPRSSRVDKESLMAHLFATTDLERNYRVNMNVIGLDGRPSVKSLPTMISEWLEFRKDIVIKRLSSRLEKVKDRLHILDGYLIAYLNIDEVIKIIRENDKPKPVLMERFSLTDIQAEAILELKLRNLAKLEEMKIKTEQDELAAEKDYLEKILNSDTRLKTLIKKEIKKAAEKFGDDRRSPVVIREEAHALKTTDIIPSEPVTIILSKNGWIRAAKGYDIDTEKLKYKSGDELLSAVHGKTNKPVLLMDTTGRSYMLKTHNLPSARSHGEPVTGRLSLPQGARIAWMLTGKRKTHILLASSAGYGFITTQQELHTKNKNGKAVLTLPKGSSPLHPVLLKQIEQMKLGAVTSHGRMLIFPLTELPVLPRGKGNKIINIPAKSAAEGERLAHLFVLPPESKIIIYSGKRHFTLTPGNVDNYVGSRGLRGKKLPRGFQSVDTIEVIEEQQMTFQPE